MMIVLFQPVWLLLLVPLAAAWFFLPLPSLTLRMLRAVGFVTLVLAMCYPAIRLPDRSGTIIVVADRSESMPVHAAAAQREVVELLRTSMGPRDLLGVVSFGREAMLERPPQRGEFAGFTAQIGPEHSNLNDAIETALALIPADGAGRVLVLSDGKWTGKDPDSAAARAAGREVAIDYRFLSRPQVNETAIQSFNVPDTVLPGQAYLLNAWVQSPVDQEIQYQLRRGATIISSGSRHVPSGLSRLAFRDRAPESGVLEYTLTIQGAKDDPIPENNLARALVGIEAPRPVLAVSAAGENSGLAQLLRAGGVELAVQTPGAAEWSLERLSQYSAVLLENVAANQIGAAGMETLASWIEETGSGFMMTGGQKSYGPGGYFKSPLDRILPVSMELRREHRKLSIAIVVALDRSGSMNMPAGGGRTKMDLANLGTAQVLDLLSPMDELGVIAVDSSPHVIVDIDTVERNVVYRDKILSIASMGGGIFVYEALVASVEMLLRAQAETRHIILFSDAADSEQPGQYRALLEKCRDANITVSVIGLGTERDVDADLLKDIAERGGGTCYFTESPDEIPRLFAQDTFTVARSTFVDQPSSFQFTAGFSLLGSMSATPPEVGGFNLCYIRPEANLAAVTTDEFSAPMVASWQAGNGRVVCFTGEADGKFSGPFAQWNQAGDFYATLLRWAARQNQPLPGQMLLTQEVRDGVCFIRLHLDPDRPGELFAGRPRVRILHGLPGIAPGKRTVPLEWSSADLLEAAIPIAGRETLLNTIEIPGLDPVTLSPVCLPYSPEFAPDHANRGAASLARIASTTGGQERIDLSETWKALPSIPRYVEIAPWLLVLGILIFLLEILERRTGWLPKLKRAGQPALPPADASAAPAAKTWRRWLAPSDHRHPKPVRPKPAAQLAAASTALAATAESQPPPSDAFRKALQRANRRTGRSGKD
jgi:Mg-chelatase subunit ChlD